MGGMRKKLTNLRRYALIATTVVVLALLPSLAWAQEGVGSPAEPNNYAVSYVLVALGVGLGLIILCRPSGRTDKPKWHDEEIGRAVQKEKDHAQ